MKNDKNRAWIEIDLDALKHNIDEIKRAISQKTKIMAVVKANATGHGSVLIARELERLGITDFAVATLDEAIELRDNGIKGNILILGYTSFENLQYVIDYDLIQTIVDYDYFKNFEKTELTKKLKCHVKINTGMNRLGESYKNIENLSEIYESDKLEVLGTFSHFCVVDSNNEKDVDFTKMQIANFNSCISKLQESSLNLGSIHLQGSYGVTNCPELCFDFVRMGIFMYGVDSSSGAYQKNRIDLKPIMTLKARISSIKEIGAGESVSYGRVYETNEPRRVAAVSIGYADGFPRCLSENGMFVKIKGMYAKVIGSICMDQMMVDITDIEGVIAGEEVILIDAKDDNLSAIAVSSKAGNIATEFLSRLGARLPRIGFYEKDKDEKK